ncbi:hypothetical protein FQN50_004956 [Emmonsiellopsis sp. PD_5]|nr:hypothetical protein FQN50_004956 [Emmonsiellopsis sp. PD_5]
MSNQVNLTFLQFKLRDPREQFRLGYLRTKGEPFFNELQEEIGVSHVFVLSEQLKEMAFCVIVWPTKEQAEMFDDSWAGKWDEPQFIGYFTVCIEGVAENNNIFRSGGENLGKLGVQALACNSEIDANVVSSMAEIARNQHGGTFLGPVRATRAGKYDSTDKWIVLLGPWSDDPLATINNPGVGSSAGLRLNFQRHTDINSNFQGTLQVQSVFDRGVIWS